MNGWEIFGKAVVTIIAALGISFAQKRPRKGWGEDADAAIVGMLLFGYVAFLVWGT